MKRFVGLDVSQATTAICVVDADGKTLAEGVTATEPGAIAAFLRRRAPDAGRIGLETGPLSVWLWNELRDLGLPVVCLDARHAHAGLKVMLAKTDRNDAAGIAQLVRTGRFRQLHIKAESSHVVRAELATRTLLVRMRCDLGNQIRGVLKTFGLVVGKAPSRLVKRAHEIVADGLAAKPELASLVASLLAMRASIVERIDALDSRLRARAKTSPVCRRFVTVPGVGPITVLAIWASIDDQARFARSRCRRLLRPDTPPLRLGRDQPIRTHHQTGRRHRPYPPLRGGKRNVGEDRPGLGLAQLGLGDRPAQRLQEGQGRGRPQARRPAAPPLARRYRVPLEHRAHCRLIGTGPGLRRFVPAGTTASSERDPSNGGGHRARPRTPLRAARVRERLPGTASRADPVENPSPGAGERQSQTLTGGIRERVGTRP